MKRWNCILGLAMAACLLNVANAGKPEKPGGKDDTEPSPVIELSLEKGTVLDINNEEGECIQAVGQMQPNLSGPTADTYAFYSKIHSTGHVLDFLPLPLAAPEGCTAELSGAKGINQSGNVVGWAAELRVWEFNEEYQFLFSWPLLWANSASSPLLLPLPAGFEDYYGAAESINDEGIVVGHIWKGFDNAVVAWKVDVSGENAVVEDCIAFLQSTAYSPSLDIDGHWVINRVTEFGLGIANVREPDENHAYRFLLGFDDSTGRLTVVTAPLFEEPAEAYAINDLGTAGGLYRPTFSAFAVDVAGVLQHLEELPPARDKGVAVEHKNWKVDAINNLEIKVGKVIGIATRYGNWWGDYPAMWDETGAPTLLHADWLSVSAINDAGWLGGSSSNRRPAIELP
jgi:hypothetical protein